MNAAPVGGHLSPPRLAGHPEEMGVWEGELGAAGRRRGHISFPEGGGKGKEITSTIDGNGNRDGKSNLQFQL